MEIYLFIIECMIKKNFLFFCDKDTTKKWNTEE